MAYKINSTGFTSSQISGGKKLDKYLADTAKRIGSGSVLRVGFIEGATYPAEDRTARFLAGVKKLHSVGPSKPGRRVFIGPRKAALSKTLPVATVAFWANFGTKRAKARPFFSDMIAEDSPTWGIKYAKILKAAQYNNQLALHRMGVYISGRLVRKISDWPADNAPLTIAIKGFNKGLVDRGVMQHAVGYDVK